MRVDEALRLSEGLVSETPKLDAELLLLDVLKRDRSFLHTWPEHQLTQEQTDRYLAMLAQRRDGRPIAHILGYRGFWTFDLEVSDATLIPRPDTEILVETALSLATSDSGQAVDLGTGTGAIALAVASELKGWKVFASDRIPAAVELARRNAKRLALENVEIREGSWFVPFSERFDLILSNPPYIDPVDPHLEQGDVRFEPRSALVAENAGLSDLEYLISHSPEYLNNGGWLVLEHGYDQAGPVRELFEKSGYSEVRQVRDLGGNMRVSAGCWSGDKNVK